MKSVPGHLKSALFKTSRPGKRSWLTREASATERHGNDRLSKRAVHTIRLIPKTIGNRKRDCAWGCAWGINTTWEICRSKSTNQFGERNERLPDLCFSICRFSQVVFIPQAQPHAQSLFLFPIVFCINLIHFFDFFNEKEERCSRKFDRVLCCFDPLSITPLDSAENTNCFEKCNVFGNGKCELSAFQKVRNWGAKFWQGKAQNSSPILRCTFLARRSAKLLANFSATMVTSLPSFSLSLSLSLYLSLSLTECTSRTI